MIDLDALITHSNFKKWLGEQTPDAVIGVATESRNCPIANFVNYHVPSNLKARVWVTKVSLMAANEVADKCSTPQWSEQFIMAVDDRARREGKCLEVTASMALEILDTIKP